jgi:two-component system, OmpR family, sensor kinase
MTSKQSVPVSAILAHCALVALWLVLAVGISAFALHLSTSAVNFGDVQLADAASGLGRMAASLAAAGASQDQLTSSITAAAKARGLDVSSQSLPRPPMPDEGAERLPPPPFGLMVTPTQIISPSGPFESPSAVLHVADTMFVFRLHDDPVVNIERGYAISMLGLIVIAMLVSFLVQRRTLRRALAPVNTIESALRRLAVGEYARLEMLGDEPTTPGVVDAYNAAADELASSIRLRAEAEANLRQFVADAGHELRTPLTVVMGFVDVLRQGAIAEQALAQRILESVAVEGERMRRLITRMLMLARLDAVAPDRRESVDLSQVVADTMQSFEPLRGATTLSTKLDPDIHVAGSQSDIREIVGILVDNAIKYAPGSRVVASTSRDDRYGILTVVDDGPGMPTELRARAFDRFSRGDERGSVPGSGLGLAIVKRIAVRADGDVDLESTPGKGTQVRVRLPIATDGLLGRVGVQ